MTLRISSKLLRQLLEQAAVSPTQEICGLLIGETEIERLVPARNVAGNPARTFEIDSMTLFAAFRSERAGEGRVLGYYHSHPDGPPTPSRRDTDMAAVDSKVWLIIGEGRAAAWKMDKSKQFHEIVLQIDG
jgi:desampylase